MQVRLAVEIADIQLHLGVLLQVIEQDGRHQFLAEQQGHADRQMPAGLTVQATGRGFGLLYLGENALAVRGKALTRFGEQHAPGAALQQCQI